MNYLLMLRTLISAIKTVEALMPDSPGKEKFDAVLVVVQELVGPVESVTPQLQAIATLLVNGWRATGVFTKKAAA